MMCNWRSELRDEISRGNPPVVAPTTAFRGKHGGIIPTSKSSFLQQRRATFTLAHCFSCIDVPILVQDYEKEQSAPDAQATQRREQSETSYFEKE